MMKLLYPLIVFFSIFLLNNTVYSASYLKNKKLLNITIKDSFYAELQSDFNHSSWTVLLEKHVSNNGEVNYKSFQTDRLELANYINLLSKNTPKATWQKDAVLAYWINAYNALTIDLILKNYPIKSIKDIKDPWGKKLWKLGRTWYSLNDIEHQILRKMEEPRIHFAIVCASISCPKLKNKAFTASDLDNQLTQATEDFLNDKTKNIITENELEVSKIFQWFAKDFKQNGTLIDFLNRYATVSISAKAKTHYKTYNWNLNGL